MAQPNSISVVVDDKTLADLRKAIGVLKTQLEPILKLLSADDRKELPRQGACRTEGQALGRWSWDDQSPEEGRP